MSIDHWLNPTRSQRTREPVEAIHKGHLPAPAPRAGEVKRWRGDLEKQREHPAQVLGGSLQEVIPILAS